MKNPFLTDGDLTLVSSLNRVPLVVSGALPINPDFKTINQLVIMPDHSQKELGRAVGLSLIHLLRGGAESRAAFPIWDDAHFNWWAGVKRIYLGGGKIREPNTVLEGIYSVFDELCETPCELIIPSNSGELPLYGAGRLAYEQLLAVKTSDSDCALAFDFGHTSVKRGIVTGVSNIELLPPIPARFTSMDDEAYIKSEGQLLHDYIVDVIVNTADEARSKGYSPGVSIGISIANYVQKGTALIRRGGYGKLLLLGDSYAAILEPELTSRMGACSPLLIHDGTAAAYAVGPQDKRCAVITLGTSIGVGFSEISREL